MHVVFQVLFAEGIEKDCRYDNSQTNLTKFSSLFVETEKKLWKNIQKIIFLKVKNFALKDKIDYKNCFFF